MGDGRRGSSARPGSGARTLRAALSVECQARRPAGGDTRQPLSRGTRRRGEAGDAQEIPREDRAAILGPSCVTAKHLSSDACGCWGEGSG